MFFLQTLFFVALAFVLGCLFGYWLKWGLTPHWRRSGAAAAISHSGAAHATTAGELTASRPHYEPASPAQRPSPVPRRPVAAAAIAPVAPQAGAVAPAVVPPAGAAAAAAPVVPPAPEAAAVAAKPKPVRTAAPKPAAKPAAAKPAKAATESPAPARMKRSGAAAIEGAEAVVDPAAAPAAAPKPAKPKPAKAKPGPAAVPDNLKQIKGVGPQIEAKLNAAGINSFAQIAAWSSKEQAQFAEQLSFAGRIEREDWVGQAKILARGGTTDFAGRVARGEVESSADPNPKGRRKP
ncbi:hypothetical protein [Hoeflea olei]|uniref:NADH:quinone oxidoreductase n=1 Tax=Hoeflea olei TaxID=1480615 RepID=A0A1C1YW36_9HYPH|nr:hypothetical protein [Hoeflea olei]OCW57695.1 hypothetical protein AWJ14_02490 [Hoeflea olei]